MNIISIEGNIGSGKSTLLHILQETYKDNPNVVFIREPVDDWIQIKDKGGANVLEKFYENQEKYGFPFQMLAYISKLNLIKESYKKNPTALFISERSLWSDRHIFAKMLYDTGKIDHICYQIYLLWFDSFIAELNICHRVIYVETNPQICYERMLSRNRNEEQCVPLHYLEQCHIYHKEMMSNQELSFTKDYFYFDGNIENIYKKEEWTAILKNLQTFIDLVR